MHCWIHHWDLQSGCDGRRKLRELRTFAKESLYRRALEQEQLKEGSEFLRGLVDRNEAVRIKYWSSL